VARPHLAAGRPVEAPPAVGHPGRHHAEDRWLRFLRFSLPIAPDASNYLDLLIIAMSLIAVVYIGFVALVSRT